MLECFLMFLFLMATSSMITLHVTKLKGIVHPKMKILSVFTHPHVVPNLYVFICSAEDIWKNVLIKQISIPIDYHSMYFFDLNPH